MMCQSCGKKESTVHFTKIVNGEIEEVHLCKDCFNSENGFGFGLPFSFKNLFSGLFDSIEEEEREDRKCPSCNWSYDDLLKIGKLGCPNCYEYFEAELKPMLKGIQGALKHEGKIPSNTSEYLKKKRLLEDLQRELNLSVSEERYEDAAKYRDEIKLVQKEIKELIKIEKDEDGSEN